MADENKIKEGDYDGIQEYDNDLPRWWVQLFWITIIGGIGYAVWFHLPSTPTPTERLAVEIQKLNELQKKSAPAPVSDPAQEEQQLLALTGKPEIVQQGATIYAGKCLACHGPQGQGLVGPNLTDNFWIHGGHIGEIKNIVVNGVLEKGMLSWKAMLTPAEIDAVVAFVWSIHGTNPPQAKAAEGIEFKR